MRDVLSSIAHVLQVELFRLGNTPVSGATLAMFVVILCVTALVSVFVRRAIVRGFRRRGVTDEGSVVVSTRLVHYAIVLLGTGVAVHTLGVNLTAFFAAGAVFAVALGFAMQNISQNFVSGVILLVERTIKPGDVLEVEGMKVKVVDMGIRTTIARTLDDEDIIIPNSILVQSVVKNHTLRDVLYRVRAPVGVVYGSDMRLVRQTLEETARALDSRVQARDPVVLLREFGDSSVNWEVSVWVDDPWAMHGGRSKLNEAIWWALKDAGITIAFPQLDLHLDERVENALESMATGTRA
ncbi:MAG: mechanosensitive ion channel [Candidatus Krumholzibacteria bacterium]|nr:mechanosensitive ion channel [Candidatus Krumholzibacteria bacterium]